MLINITLPLIFVLVMDEEPRIIHSTRPQKPMIYYNESRYTSEFKGIPRFIRLKDDEKREIFYYEQTIVVRDSDVDNDTVRRCEALEVYEEGIAEEALFQLEEILKIDAVEVDMNEMMDLLENCDSVNENQEEWGKTPEPETELMSKSSLATSKSRPIAGVIPGTNWCGFGDIAESYHDLGIFRDVDKCCRFHDLCPIKILAKDKRYNLENDSMYTKSHCRCDEAFYDCLKKENGITAKFIGKIFFNSIAQPTCIDGVPEIPDEEMHFVQVNRDW